MSYKKDNRTESEIKADIQLLGTKPEIDKKLNFYKDSLFAVEQMYNTIDERIDRGYILEERSFLGIFKIKVKKFLDSYEIGKLKLDKVDLDADAFAKKGFYETWVKRRKEYEKRFEEISLECNEFFDETLKKAKDIASKGQIRLQHTIERYDKEGKHDQKEKNDFYMYMRKEIANAIEHSKSKR